MNATTEPKKPKLIAVLHTACGCFDRFDIEEFRPNIYRPLKLEPGIWDMISDEKMTLVAQREFQFRWKDQIDSDTIVFHYEEVYQQRMTEERLREAHMERMVKDLIKLAEHKKDCEP